MRAQRGNVRLLLALAGVTAWLLTDVRVFAGKPTLVPVASMKIDASIDHNPLGYRLLNDGKNDYVDYQLPPSYGPDKCVNGEIYSAGLAFMRLNHRKVNNTLCSALDPDNNVPRQVRMIIGDVDACEELLAPPLVEGQLSAAPCLFTTPTAPKQPHVRIETAFKNKVTRTWVQLQFHAENLRDYHINTDVEAPMAGPADVKTVTYDGTATLYRYTGITGSAWEPIGAPFYFPFQLTVTRVYASVAP